MQKDVRTNFEEKVSYIAHTLPGMTVTEHSDFLAVDCGLPSDTFNVLVVREMSTQAEMLAMVDRFNAKRFPLAVWYWGGHLADPDQALFLQHGLWPAETHVAMAANLSEVKAGALPPPDLELKRVTTASELLQFGEVTAALFGASDEGRHVFAYFERLAQHPPSRFPAMRHYLGTLDGTVVAIGTLFVGSQTTGVYDLVTRDDYRRRGIGSAMFQHLLREACSCNRRLCVLQASPEGLGIYSRAGFKAVGQVHTLENRRHLVGRGVGPISSL